MSRSVRDQAECYRQLATLMAAGLPPARAVLQLSPFPQQARLAADLRRGHSVASALAVARLARPWEQPLLTAAETAGRLPETLARLADHHEAVSRRLRTLRGQLVMPAAVWALALFVLPLPALVRGDLDATGYLLRSLVPLLLMLFGARLWVRAWRQARARQAALPGERHLHRLPWLGDLLFEAQRAQGLQVLALLLQAGLPADVALRSSAEAVPFPSLRRGLAEAAKAAADGVAFIDSLPAAGLVNRGAERAMLQSGEAAGRVDDTVALLAHRLQAEVDERFDSLGRWLPRGLYFLLVIPILI